MKSGGIFISYRRGASGSIVDRINDYLVREFSADAVFMDIDSVGYGAEFPEAIRTSLDKSRTVLAIIGPEWMDPRDPGGPRSPSKWVQMEIESALARRDQGMVVIPVLVGGAQLPKQEDLPPSLNLLPMLNAAEIRQGRDFKNDMALLVRKLPAATRRLQLKPGGSKRVGVVVGAGVVAATVLVAAFMWPKPTPSGAPELLGGATVQPAALADQTSTQTTVAPTPKDQSTGSFRDSSDEISGSAPQDVAKTAPPVAPSLVTQPTTSPAAIPALPQLSAEISGLSVSKTHLNSNNTVVSLKFQLAIKNSSGKDVGVMVYAYDTRRIRFVFSGGGSVTPNFNTSSMSIDVCSEVRSERCSLSKKYTPIVAGQTVDLAFDIRGAVAKPLDERANIEGSGALHISLLVDDGSGKQHIIPLILNGVVDARNY